jgi:hypothetical protein
MAITSCDHFDPMSNASTDEYLVVLMSARRFDRLLRKDDFLDEGVAAVFGLAGEQAELLALSFHAVGWADSDHRTEGEWLWQL